MSSLASADRADRQARLLELMLAGHVPDRLRALAPVTVDAKDAHGRMRRLVLFVARDYLSVGTNDDAVRVPLDAHAAQLAVDALGCMLPTPRMVDLIWRSAQRLPPQPWGPPYGAPMLSVERALTHSSRIDARIKELGLDPDGLLAGHKKDVVLSNRLQAKPRSVAIYGWHNTDGTVIQPLSLVHESTYADCVGADPWRATPPARRINRRVRICRLDECVDSTLAAAGNQPGRRKEGRVRAYGPAFLID